MNMRLQHQSLVEHEIVREHPLERRIQIVQDDFGQESQTAHIHTENRNAALAGQSRRIEHRAVASQHEQHIGLAGEMRFLKPALLAKQRRRGRIQENVDVPGTKPRDHGLHRAFHFRKFWFRQDADALTFHT